MVHYFIHNKNELNNKKINDIKHIGRLQINLNYLVGTSVGTSVGLAVGKRVGGRVVGAFVGERVGERVGNLVGEAANDTVIRQHITVETASANNLCLISIKFIRYK